MLGPPDKRTRALVFKAILLDVKKENNFDYSECSSLTEGYTPSDITALCSAAVAIPVQERNIAIKKYRNKIKPIPVKPIIPGSTVKSENNSAVLVSEQLSESNACPLRPLKMKVRCRLIFA